LEHNIQVLSKIYLNITFQDLANFLEIEKAKTESLIADMIVEKRIKAQLDQHTESIDFEVESG